MLKAENIKKEYRVHGKSFKIIKDINLTIYDGDFVSIMGPSGAGKSTLLNMLSTIEKPTQGRILYNSKDVTQMKNKELSRFRKDNIGFIFQDYNLIDSMTIEDNIALPLVISGERYSVIREEVSKFARFFGIEEQLGKYPYELSGGQKQKAAAARAMIIKPKVLFADEPTGALDSRSSIELLNCLSKMNRESEITIIMVTHDAFAASYSKKVMFIKDGNINAQIDSDGNRKKFFDDIMKVVASTGGEINETI